MHRITASIAALGLCALTLVGCAASAPASCERPQSDASVLDLITADGPEGTPAVTLKSPVYTQKTVFTDLTRGDGLAVTSDHQDVQFTVTLANGSNGQTLMTSGTQIMPVSQWRSDYNGFAEMLTCATAGSRVVGAVAPEDLSERAAASFGLTPDQSLVVVLDLEKVYPAAADGAPQYNDRRGMPSVVLAPDGTPGVTIPDSAPPAELAVETLKKGSGEKVAATDTVRVQYTGITWADKTVFDSTWSKGASTALNLEKVVPGFAQALTGQTVGSQVLAVIPPELGYGTEGSGAIPGGATLVFVIDILGIEDPAAANTAG